MNKDWVEKKEAEQEKKIAESKNRIVKTINNCKWLDDGAKTKLIAQVDAYEKEPYHTAHVMFLMVSKFAPDAELEQIEAFLHELKLDNYLMSLRYRGFHHLLDSEPKKFDGDIIITDPCYIIKHRDRSTEPKWEDYMKLPDYRGMTKEQLEEAGYFEDYKKMQEAQARWDEENPDDWDVCKCGDDMGAIGLKNWMTRSTIYGDWSCTTFNSDTKEVLGKFCADAGMVGVFDLNEVLAYNPEYDDHVEKPWTTTLIKDFRGTVRFIVEENKRSRGEDFDVRVVGRGVNKKTGEPLNFITSQTVL